MPVKAKAGASVRPRGRTNGRQPGPEPAPETVLEVKRKARQKGAVPERAVPQNIVVIVPGFMGSQLRDRRTGKIAWIDFSSVPKNPLKWGAWLDDLFQTMAYPNDNLEPAGIIDDVIFVPPLFKQEQYSRLIRALEDLGYKADPQRFAEEDRTVYPFAYDWRQDNRISARQLGEAIRRWKGFHPGAQVWIIAHSNGGLVARWYIEKEGGKDEVQRIFMMASPWDGVPKAMQVLFQGLDVLFRPLFNPFDIRRRTRDLVRTFPSIYQLIPRQNPFLTGPNNEAIDPFAGEDWLDDPADRQRLSEGCQFGQELGTSASVEELCFFGRKQPTATAGIVTRGPTGRWKEILWTRTEAGDGTLPERSAIHPHANEKLPFVAGHGDIYVVPPVLEFLQFELGGKYTFEESVRVVRGRLSLELEVGQDIVRPGEKLRVMLAIGHVEAGKAAPVSNAKATVQWVWQGSLPGSSASAQEETLPTARLREVAARAGSYEVAVNAPGREGYYAVRVSAKVKGQPEVTLEELVAVDHTTAVAEGNPS